MTTDVIAAPAITSWDPEKLAFFDELATGTGNIRLESLAGTGKTTAIVEGSKRCALGRRQLFCAFAKRNQEDLAKKLADNPNATVKTLNALGFGQVQLFWERVGMEKRRGDRVAALVQTVCGDQTPDAIKRLVAKLTDYGRQLAPHAKALGDLTAVASEYDCVPDEQWEAYGYDVAYIEARALEAMELAATKRPMTGIDFADQLFLPVRNRWMRPTYDDVFVDEYQDMTATQLELAAGLCRDRLILVGDQKQAIYAFRGADMRAAEALANNLKAKVMNLNVTYRCPKAVVAEAQRLVPEYRAADSAPDGKVDRLPSIEKMIEAVDAHDFILSRTNAPLANIAMALLRAQKRVRIQGKDIGADLIALIRKLATGRAKDSVPELLKKLGRWEEREADRAAADGNDAKAELVRDKAETLRALMDGVSGVRELIARLDHLFDDDRNGGSIVCSSVHKAKGLEAKRVFLLRDTLHPPLPQRVLARITPEQLEKRAREERNIEYVAITRAMDTLVYVDGKPGKGGAR